MLGTGYFLKIAKINYQQEKPICPNCKNQFLQKCTKNCQSAKINSRKNFMPQGRLIKWEQKNTRICHRSKLNCS